LAATSLVIGTLVPIAEETMFRGVVFPVLRARIGNTLGAVIVSALIFGGFHLYPLQIVVGCVLGLPLAWLRHWSGSLVAPIALHMTHNLCVVLIAALRII
jgi:membrane protease YdiL (CAAX protease family)